MKFINNISSALYPLTAGSIILIANRIKTGQATNPLRAIGQAAKRYMDVVKASIVAGLIILLGFLLIVPGIVFLVKYALITPIVILEGDENGKPRDVSANRTKGIGWSIFWVGIILFVMQSVLGVLPEFLPVSSNLMWGAASKAIYSSIYDILGIPLTLSIFLFYWKTKEEEEGVVDLECLSR
jgi:hypothetical protein